VLLQRGGDTGKLGGLPHAFDGMGRRDETDGYGCGKQ
jgi:hypothetical protein